MVYSSYITYAQTIMQANWGYFFPLAASYTNTSGGAVTISNAVFMSYSGACLAFVLALVGAYDNASKTLYYVEDSMDDF